MNEHGYSQKLRKKLAATGRVFQWKINDNYAGGVPDLFIEGPISDLWLESKRIQTLPKRDTTVIDLCNTNQYLSKLQQIWLARRADVRGDAAVLVSHDAKAAIFFNREWEMPITTLAFTTRLLSIDEIVERILART